MTHNNKVSEASETQIVPVQGEGDSVIWMEEFIAEDGTIALRPAANDTLYEILERRYGGGFAQWVIDGLNRQA